MNNNFSSIHLLPQLLVVPKCFTFCHQKGITIKTLWPAQSRSYIDDTWHDHVSSIHQWFHVIDFHSKLDERIQLSSLLLVFSSYCPSLLLFHSLILLVASGSSKLCKIKITQKCFFKQIPFKLNCILYMQHIFYI